MILTHGSNSISRGGGSPIDPDIVILQDWMTVGVGIQPSSGNIPNTRFDSDGPLDVSGTGWSGTPYVKNSDIANALRSDDLIPYCIVYDNGISALNLTSNNSTFTIEAYLRLTATTTLSSYRDSPLIGLYGTKDSALGTFDGSQINFYNNGRKNPGFTLTLNTWHHIAIVCNNGTITGFFDGVVTQGSSLDTFSSDKFAIVPRTYRVSWGTRYNSPQYDYAQICLTKRAKWTSNFTPPTRPYCLGIQ